MGEALLKLLLNIHKEPEIISVIINICKDTRFTVVWNFFD